LKLDTCEADKINADAFLYFIVLGLINNYLVRI
jgi:hypothetical protein